MIVRNGSLAIAARISNTTSLRVGELVDINGEKNTKSMSVSLNLLRSICHEEVASGNTGIVMNLGSGTTEPTPDDYWLAEPIDSVNYSCVAPAVSSSVAVDDNGDLLYTFVFKVSPDVTVNEICLSYLSANGKHMLARKVIPPRTGGGLQTFTYVIKVGG